VDHLGIRAIALALVAVGSAWAQQDLFDLAVTGDGASAYFATALGRKGSGDLVLPGSQLTRIHRVDTAGVELYLERLPAYPPPITERGQIAFTNYFRLSHPETSRDGKVVAVTGQRQCTGGDFCVSQVTLETTIAGLPGGTLDFAGAGRLSGNGRYLLIYSDGSLIGPPGSVMDLQTGQSTVVLAPLDAGRLGFGRVIADDGTAVVAAGNIWIAHGSAATQVHVASGSAVGAVIDGAGQTVVYSAEDYATGVHSIHSYQLAGGRDRVLAALPGGTALAPYISADGRRVMFVSDASGLPQTYTMNTDGSGLRQVSRDASGVGLAAMSDDGKVVWYFSGTARLYQMNLDTSEAREMMGRTPQLGFRTRMAAGSAYTIVGAGLSDDIFTAGGYPLPKSLGGVSVTVNGVDAPLYTVSPTQIVLQVPWGILGDTNAEVKTPGTSPFDPQLSLPNTTLTGYGLFLTLPHSPSAYGGLDALAVHEDWSAPVTAENPARPNETIHLYGTGLGRVDAAQADGMPAPGNPPARTVVPVTCWAWGEDNVTRLDIPVLFAGLAPGMAGYYQMDVRLPAANLRPSIQLSCTGEGDSHDFLGTFAVAAK
jgi:uncharacterized protein (TIGR03437 family)